MLKLIRGITAEISGTGENAIYVDDAVSRLEKLCAERPGSVSLIYMDPPFMTGKKFEIKAMVGKDEWKSGKGTLVLPAYSDTLKTEDYLALMRRVLCLSKQLLAPDGLIVIHVDYRANAYIRLMADEIFGEDRFINEIIWAYESGGRSKYNFARKHDVILLYAASDAPDLHIDDVAEVQRGERKIHMARGVDEDGRTYRHMTVGGKTYRYYDDEPVPPSDVWTDVSHLQQRDPQRTGFETQKPLKLLERIVKCASREGDTVLDPFFGSGTSLEAAADYSRRFIGIDSNPLCSELARARAGENACIIRPENDGAPLCEAERVEGITFASVYLEAFQIEEGLLPFEAGGLDAVNGWAVGTVKNGVFYEIASETRSRKEPALKGEIRVPINETGLCLRISDVLGRRFFYEL